MINIQNIKAYISTNDISFLIDFDKTIDIDKSKKTRYFRIYNFDYGDITNFISSLHDEEIYLVNPIMSINCRYSDPYLSLLRPFLVSNNSNSTIIFNYLNEQLDKASIEYNFPEKDVFYWDEITPYGLSLWEWIWRRRGDNDGDPGNNNPNNRYNSWINYLGLNQNRNRNRPRNLNRDNNRLNIPDNPGITEYVEDESLDILNVTEPIDEYFPAEDVLNKGKDVIKDNLSPVLTSPSLENLNSKVEESWSRSNSPQSSSSTATLRPIEIPENVASSSSVILDEALYLDKPGIKPFIDFKALGKSKIVNESSWRNYLNKGILERMNFIENTFHGSTAIDVESRKKMCDNLKDICNSYDNIVKTYENNKKKNYKKNLFVNQRQDLSFMNNKEMFEVV